MTALFTGLGRFTVRFRIPIVIFWIVVTAFSVRAFPSLASVAKDTNSGFLPASAPSIQASNLAGPFQNSTFAAATIVGVRSNGALTTQDQSALDAIENAVKKLNHVKVVRDLGVSRDGGARQALVQANVARFGGSDDDALVKNIRAVFTSVATPSGLSVHLTGELATTVDNQSSSRTTRGSTTGLSLLFIIVLLLVVFRAVLAPLITLFPAVLVLALSSPAIAGATRFGVQASSITQIILIVLVLGAGTDYGLFLIFRVREELRRGLEPHDAVVRAVSTVGESITFSALTVIVALMSLLIAQFGLYQSLGPALAIGIALMLLAGLTLLPALLAIFGRAVFWPTRAVKEENSSIGLWGRLTGSLIRNPIVTLVVGLVFFIALSLGFIGSPSSGFADRTAGPSGTDSASGQAALTTHFPGASANATEAILHFPRSVWTDLSTVEAAQARLGAIAAVSRVIGPLDPNGVVLTTRQLGNLHRTLGPAAALPLLPPASSRVSPLVYRLYRSTAQYISPDGHTVQFLTVLKNATGNTAAVAEVPVVRAAVTAAATAVGADSSGVFSRNSFTYDVQHTSADDLAHLVPTVAVLIALLLALVLRSLVAPLYLVVSVVLSYLAALGLVALVFVHLGGQAGVNFVLPFLMFVFLMALGSDYNILVMTRIREEAQQLPLKEAVRHAMGVTGTTVTTAGIILAGSFGVLGAAAGSASGADQVRQIGFGIAAGIVMDTFLIRTLLVPATVVLLGHWNWWPSPLFRRPADAPAETAARGAA